MSAREELNKIKETWGLENDLELAIRLQTNKGNIDSWVKRDKIPEKWTLKIGQMYRNEKIETNGYSYPTTIEEQELLNSLRDLPKDRQEIYFNEIKTGVFRETVNVVNIPYFEDTYASAGNGAINYENVQSVLSFDLEFLQSILGINSFRNLHIIKAIGDSMEPLITSGELLFINPIENDGNSIATGGIYVVRYYDDYLVKKLDRNSKTKELTLISENKTYADVPIVGEDLEHCTIIGRVVGHFDRI